MKYILVIMVIASGFFFSYSFAQMQDSSQFGSLAINKNSFVIGEDLTILQIFGNIENFDRGARLDLTINGPNEFTKELETLPSSTGEFSTSVILDTDWEKGNYSLTANYRGNEVGTVSFVITDVEFTEPQGISTVGTIEIEQESYVIVSDRTIVEISGEVFNNKEDLPIIFSLSKPDGETSQFTVNPRKDSSYVARITILPDWSEGTYRVTGTYDEKDLGIVTFSVSKSSSASVSIPDWIRNNAKWFAEGAISESDFTTGIEFMINSGIIKIPDVPEAVSDESESSVPEWVKNNAKWWSDGLISDDDFVKGIQYLVQKGIIRIK